MPYDYDFDEDFEVETGDSGSAAGEEVLAFACEDCDHRWEEDSYEAEDAICPMCGSSVVIEL
ncbi:hypothetical protein LEP1GSC060_2123 [Leptospira weilii serovar Ranarum str. ICFT]|uniref:Zinc ribbon domain protein n=1 Tax=Leptospira weilii serovar Ranarum str. ICFT TaxID=1218598 RepID=N1WEX9_9LEPT|nr:hypothetical protein [Leptospira weilii]EMY78806.1 hypothetical protein LEP1GSC060_2123 [Leptospira weilii serovar Ranarum str. ICFT]